MVWGLLRRTPSVRLGGLALLGVAIVKVWTYDLSGSSSMRRLTYGGNNRYPTWSADREGDAAIFWQGADGTDAAERLARPEPGTIHVAEGWAPTATASWSA